MLQPSQAVRRLTSAQMWTLHLLALVLPASALTFVASGPHIAGWSTFGALGPLAAMIVFDRAGTTRHTPPATIPGWWFDVLLYGVAGLHFAIMVLTLRMLSRQNITLTDAVMVVVVVGINSAYSAVVVGHEMIHRRGKRERFVGRALLCTIIYDHFAIEHLRGHHARSGTPEDPATARYGEGFWSFLLRSPVGQLRSAWRIDMRSVVLGKAAEIIMLLIILGVFGARPLVIFLLHALVAWLLVEVINYLEHWGLERRRGGRRLPDSWDCDSLVTHFALMGLARHADHHARPSRSFPHLVLHDRTPKLPHGYFRMALLVLLSDAAVRHMLTAELRRSGLGPMVADSSGAGNGVSPAVAGVPQPAAGDRAEGPDASA